jgi:exodeoxyribonuclease VIII
MGVEVTELPKGKDLALHTHNQYVMSMDARLVELIEPLEPGRYPLEGEKPIEMEDYLAFDALNASTLNAICPPGGDAAQADWQRRHRSASTDSQKLGTAIHKATLEPEAFDSHYIVTPLRGKGLVTYKQELRDEGYTMISQTDMDIARTARDAVHAHPLASKLLDGVEAKHVEQTFFFDAEAHTTEDIPITLRGKMRADLCRDDLGIWVDIKSTRKIDPRGWSQEAAQWGYDLTKCWYMLGAEDLAPRFIQPIETYLFLVIENALPCHVELYEMGPSSTTMGTDRMNLALRLWATAVTLKKYPGRGDGEVRPFDLPEYAFNQFYVEGREMSR